MIKLFATYLQDDNMFTTTINTSNDYKSTIIVQLILIQLIQSLSEECVPDLWVKDGSNLNCFKEYVRKNQLTIRAINNA